MSREFTVAVLSYKRPESLVRTLRSIEAQIVVPHGFSMAFVLVIDNDAEASARPAVNSIRNEMSFEIVYVVEPEPGVSAARNRAIDEAATLSALVFIDDDEVVTSDWPAGLLRVLEMTGAAMVGGPVRTAFEPEPEPWIVEGGYFERQEPTELTEQSWLRSGNLVLDLDAIGQRRFDLRFGDLGGEDVEFSSRLRRSGQLLSWSSSAIVTEFVGADRANGTWIVNRQRLSQANYIQALRQTVTRRTLTLQLLRTAADACCRLIFSEAKSAVGRPSPPLTSRLQIARIIGMLDGLRR